MLMTFLGMKLKVTQNRRRKGRVCRMLPFPLGITVRRLVTIPTAWGNFAHAHIVITNWLIMVKQVSSLVVGATIMAAAILAELHSNFSMKWDHDAIKSIDLGCVGGPDTTE